MVNETTPPAPIPPKLLEQVRDKLRVKHYSIRTETQYIHWIKMILLFLCHVPPLMDHREQK